MPCKFRSSHLPALCFSYVAMQARATPQTHAELVNYLLDTAGEEMEYETVRCRPLITDEFFTYLGQQIGMNQSW